MDDEIVKLITDIEAKRLKLGISIKYIAEWEEITVRTAYNWLKGKHLSDHIGTQRGRKGLRRILAWLSRLEAGTEPMPLAEAQAPPKNATKVGDGQPPWLSRRKRTRKRVK